MIRYSALALGLCLVSAITGVDDERGIVKSRLFGHLPGGQAVTEYALTNRAGVRVNILDYGGIITELHVPDRDGVFADVVLGFDELMPYTTRHPYFGAIVGRYAGRIANGRFSIDGVDFRLARNNGGNHLHGGDKGFDQVVWIATTGDMPNQLVLSHVSPDGDEGYPGTLSIQVTYTLTEDNELRVEYSATTDAPTVLNLTQHTYFNLSGGGDVLGHELHVRADSILELDEASIPTGMMLPVARTPFDFRAPKPVGQDIDAADPQLLLAKGYDHNWVLTPDRRASAVVLSDPDSGRRLEVLTSEPGVQIYTANYLNGSVAGKGGRAYPKHAGIALETQHFPDSPNQPEFPSTALIPGDTFRSETVFRFRAE